jgi:hypothetical protein
MKGIITLKAVKSRPERDEKYIKLPSLLLDLLLINSVI